MADGLKSSDRVRAAAAALGLAIEIREMPQSTRTAAEAAAACGTSIAQIVKSLVFRKVTSGAAVLLLVSGKNRVDEVAVKAAIGDTVQRMDANAVREVTGFAIGGVAPFGSIKRLPTFIDEDLMAFDRVFAAAGAPTAIFEVAPKGLAEAIDATIIKMS